MRHTLEFVADYTVDCSVLNSTVTHSLLEDVAKQKYSIIDILCDSGINIEMFSSTDSEVCRPANSRLHSDE